MRAHTSLRRGKLGKALNRICDRDVDYHRPEEKKLRNDLLCNTFVMKIIHVFYPQGKVGFRKISFLTSVLTDLLPRIPKE